MADLFCSEEFTPSDKLAAVEREITYRRRVYERLVSEGKMKPAARDRGIAIFEAIAEDYRRKLYG